ncbi:Uncharacterized conserved protein [Phaffia rhodozyma]|uniref:Uncharacterized conserved protein n=1 Tax=Phaffia rhodozyma TaxID=264483 RepID=A0A0F7SF54_PHARH|nr:Uncharacterized conserved protein [Phaffia rhodozyma]
MSTSTAALLQSYQPDRFNKLRSLLSSLFSPTASSTPHVTREIYTELEKAKPWFLNLLRVPPPKAEEKTEVEKGSIKIKGKSSTLNPEFIAETLFLSTELSLSELYCAHLLRAGIKLQSRYGNRPATETAVLLFHMERLDMLACLHLIFDPAVMTEGVDGSALDGLRAFGKDLKGSIAELDGGKEGSLVERALLDLDHTKDSIKKLQGSIDSVSGRGALTTGYSFNSTPTATSSATPAGPKLSPEVIQERVFSLKGERNALGHFLFLMSYTRNMRKKEVQSLIRWLAKLEKDDVEGEERGLVGYLVTTALAAFDLNDIKLADVDHDKIIQERFLRDTQFIKIMTSEIVERPWKFAPLQSAITLQWALFLVEAFRHNRNLEQETRLTEEAVESMASNAIRNDAFQFLTSTVVSGSSSLSSDTSSSTSATNSLVLASDTSSGAASNDTQNSGSKTRQENVVDPSFKWYILTQVDLLIGNFVTTMSPILRKIKHKEEDAILNPNPASSSRRSLGASASHGPNSSATAAPSSPPRADVEALFILVAAVYRDCPADAGLKFWNDKEGRLFAFLRWAADSRTAGMIRALFEMLASLSVGPQSSTFAFDFLATDEGERIDVDSSSENSLRVCSWSSLFAALSFYATQLPKITTNSQTSLTQSVNMASQPRRDSNSPSTIPPDEITLLKSFLLLLKNVVLYSPVARAALYENQQFKSIPTLLLLINSNVSIGFKAALFDTLAAFCGPEAGPLGADISKQMWVALDRLEIVPSPRNATAFGEGSLYRSSSFGASRSSLSSGGIITEFQDAESSAKTYPATTSFVHLLDSLIHTPAKSSSLITGFEIDSPTLPDSMGSGSRTPGISAYVRFVLEDVFLKAPKLVYSNPAERWNLTERSLCFIEKCLASYDLSPLLAEEAVGGYPGGSFGKAGGQQRSAVVVLALHPGFEVLRKFLTEPALLKGLFEVVSVGLDGLAEDSGRTSSMTKAVLRSLRIVYRILQIQSLFIEVLLPTLAESSNSFGFNTASLLSAIAPLDQHLLYSHPVVVQIALFVNYAEDLEFSLLAVKIISLLSQSAFFMATDRFENVYSSHMNRLVGIIDSSDESLRILDGFVRKLEVNAIDGWSPEDPLESLLAPTSSISDEDYTEVIRSSILDLLIQNTAASCPGPNIAHFLSGFNLNKSSSELAIDDPQAQGTTLSCLHIVFELLAQGAKRDTDDEEADLDKIVLWEQNPSLAEKCARLVYQLCVHEFTGQATTRYIRTREDYCARQLASFPLVAPSVSRGISGSIIYPNGQQIPCSAADLASFLRFRSFVLDTVSLELHIINPTGLHATKLVDILFKSPLSVQDAYVAHVAGMDTHGQPLAKIIDVLLSLDFEWKDSIDDADMKLVFFAKIDFNTCLQVNDRGCEVYDIRALLSAMNAVRRKHQQMGALSSDPQQKAIRAETRGILLTLAAENHRREVAYAKQQCLISWQRALDVCLFKSFELVPIDQRESLIFDLLQAIFHHLSLPDCTPQDSELLGQTLLSLVTKLRQGRQEQTLRVEDGKVNGSLPSEKLQSLLRRIIELIIRAGTTELFRGNLYTVLANYLQLVTLSSTTENHSASNAIEEESGLTFKSAAQSSVLESGSLSILVGAMDRLAPIICKDALDGSQIWKTVAYTALESLVTASRTDRSHKLLNLLARHGYLRNFVQSLKDTEEELRRVLVPDPDDLNAFYVFEAKSSLLIQISLTRNGAERLLEARLFETLSQCYMFEDRPEAEDSMTDYDSFLPPAIERYHQILIPVLQLTTGVLSSVGSTSPVGITEALGFINAHRETILALLKDTPSVTSLISIKELSLLVSLFTHVLPRVAQEDLSLLSGFGAFHAALLALGGRFFLREKWEDLVVPTNDAEQADSQRPSPGTNRAENLFEYNMNLTVEDLHKNLLAYYVATTETGGGQQIQPVLSPSISSREPKHGAPTISAAIALFYETVIHLRSTVDQFQDIALKLSQPELLSTDDIEEIILSSTTEETSKYSTAQRKRLALQQLSKLQTSSHQQGCSALFLVDTLLLLIWRHFLHFLNNSLKDGSSEPNWNAIVPSSVSLRFSQNQSPGEMFGTSGGRKGVAREMWERSSEELSPALGKLESVDLPIELFGSEVNVRQSYVSIMVRRLREVLSAASADQ